MQQYNTYDSEFEKKIVAKAMEIMAKYTQEMEADGYYRSNPGMSEDDYEDVAQEIVRAINQ